VDGILSIVKPIIWLSTQVWFWIIVAVLVLIALAIFIVYPGSMFITSVIIRAIFGG
jgi:hypothetical protein